MNIEKFTLKDLESIKLLLEKNLRFHTEIDPLKIRNFSVEKVENDFNKFQSRINTEGFCCYVAKDSDKIIGFGYAYVDSFDGEGKCDTGKISKVYIDSDYRGKGIGSEIMKFLEDSLIGLGCKKIDLSVFAPNKTAHDIYLKRGYKDRFIEMTKVL